MVFHPLTAWADHGDGGNGEPLAIVLRAGNTGPDTAAGHVEATRLALAQLPRRLRRRVLVRTDSGDGTHGFLTWLTTPSRRLHYSVGMTITQDMQAAILQVPASAWTPAYDADQQVRDGAWAADVTGLLDLSSWPPGMRIIVRKERPHPGVQLRLTDPGGHRLTAFATDAKRGQLADLELRHRRRARCEDRIRCAKDTGLRNLPLKGFAQNQLWCEIVALACELLAWTQLLALTGTARRWDRNASACASSPSPAAWPPAVGDSGSASPNDGPGPARSPPPSPACKPSRLADQPEQPDDQEGGNTRDRGTPPSRAAGHRPHQKINPSRTPQASRSRSSYWIEVSVCLGKYPPSS